MTNYKLMISTKIRQGSLSSHSRSNFLDLTSTCGSSIVIEMTHKRTIFKRSLLNRKWSIMWCKLSLQEVRLNRNCHSGLTLYTAIQFYPHWYPVLPLYWFKTNVTRCDWWVKVVINHGILIYVSSKNLWINNIRSFPLNLWYELI